jgi:hypothetical protein
VLIVLDFVAADARRERLAGVFASHRRVERRDLGCTGVIGIDGNLLGGCQGRKKCESDGDWMHLGGIGE